jgi:dTDP-4-amino-4,6-dideoxygalactose transaminase
MSKPVRVPYNYLPMQFADYSEIAAGWDALIKTADFTLGAFMEKFEGEFADYIGSPHCLATNNGTDALILALKALGIGPGDEVITPCNSFYATTGAIVAVGATPVFCDVDERFQTDVNDAARRVTARTKALLPVHWAGASPDVRQVMDLAHAHNLLVLEDACMAIGGAVHGTSPGTNGDMGAFSMHPLKTLNVMGDGGMVITKDDDRLRWMLKYRNHGMIDRDHIDMWGVNMRLQPLQAIVASHMLTSLDERLARRREVQSTYDERLGALGPSIVVPPRADWNPETVSLYMFEADDRDSLIAHLVANGVEAKVHYPVPLHLQKPGRELGYGPGDMPVAEAQAGRLITLPAHEYLTDEQVEFTCGVVTAYSSLT